MIEFSGATFWLLAAAAPAALAGLFLLRVAWVGRRAKRRVRTEPVIGLRGRAETEIAPTGAVFVRGELWRARADRPLARGEAVRVTGMDGVTLRVERAD